MKTGMGKLIISFASCFLLCLTCFGQANGYLIFFRDKKTAGILTVFYLEKQNKINQENIGKTILIDRNIYLITKMYIPSIGSEIEACCETDTLDWYGVGQLNKLYRKLGESKQDSLLNHYDKLYSRLRFETIKHSKLTKVDISMDIYSMSVTVCKCLKYYFSNDFQSYQYIFCIKSLNRANKLTKNEKKYFRINFDVITDSLKKQR